MTAKVEQAQLGGALARGDMPVEVPGASFVGRRAQAPRIVLKLQRLPGLSPFLYYEGIAEIM